MARKRQPPIGLIPRETLASILEKTPPVLIQSEQRILCDVVDSYFSLTERLREQSATLARLRRFMGMTGSEKTADVLGRGDVGSDDANAGGANATVDAAALTTGPADTAPADPTSASASPATANGTTIPAPDAGKKDPLRTRAKPKRKGHGRVPAAAYPDAQCISVLHDDLRRGEVCPLCGCGRLYELPTPSQVLRIVGQPPLTAICWRCERLRCSGCGHVFTARPPEAAQGPKYDETAVSMMALLRYRAGMPVHRLDHLERNLATPVPASTQWDVVNERVGDVRPAFEELCRQAAQGQIVHNDDSYARILAFMGKRRAALLAKGELASPERTGIFTTAIVSIWEGKPIALFFTGRKHAGENLSALLGRRATDLAAPLLMSDALDRNVPKGHAVVEANCLAHGRRHVVDEIANFPDECEQILVRLGKVFRIDHLCRRHGLSPAQRLRVHQRWSGPVMAQLEAWMNDQFAMKRIEPNSGLGQAMNYLLKRWDKVTRFLQVAGAPIDNNICERALKMAIRHRNNSLFYKSQHGANVGDVYMTLIHTAELRHENPFDYLTALLRNAKAVANNPADWLPWTYRQTLERSAPRDTGRRDAAGPRPPAVRHRPPGPVPTSATSDIAA
jgi:hypothetical protein